MMLNYNPLDDGRDTWSKNDVGDTTGSPPLTRTAPSWWRGLSLVFALFIGLHAFALGGDKSKATLADAATTCAGAIVLSPTSLPINGQNLVCGSTDDLNSTTAPGLCATGASNFYKGGNEALYSFTPTVTGDYQVSISGQTWTGIFVFQGCPTSGGTCVGSIGSSASSKSINVSLTAGLE
ncbi:MAG TPA: hypothetical protein PLA69_07475, partial [Flavobacterium sp.]|nr:hypothetical protein [Flavobacterium sp.]